jgi:nitrogen-specific signal transduction histidine kinase/CheY-like chemotaxis protein
MKSEAVFPLEHAGWPALLLDSTSTICRANASAVKLFGASLEGSNPLLSAIWCPENQETAEQFLAHWERSPSPTVPLKLRAKGGSSVQYQVSVCAFSKEEQKYFVLQLLADTSQAAGENSHGPLAHKQKLDCALQLARTISLDFNNALTTILGHTSLVLSRMEPDHEWRSSLLAVEKSAGKAAEIANDLGAFSRQEKEVRTQASGNLNLLLQRSVESFQQNPGAEPLEWTLQLERKLFAAKFDEAKMLQAFLRILENALEAMRGPGRISIQTRNFELTEPTQDRNVQLAPGAYVCIEIADNGCGIEPEILPRIFEPFFSTKDEPHRGLGLAWVYGIITNHGGGVAVSSQPDAGTSVRIYLPAENRIIKDNGGTTIQDLKGTQTVMIVDDEDLVLKMGQTILSAYGYRVHTASSGQRALDMLAQGEVAMDLVITDLVMPAMSGRELVEHIQRLSPATRILCTSGYVWPSNQRENSAYLQKPFTSQDLLLKVKEALVNGNG